MQVLLIGLLAGTLTTLSSVPQIVRIFRTRSVADLSLLTLSMFACGTALWILYGIATRTVPVIFWNSVGLALYAVLIGLRLRLRVR
ncbi:MAG TPA: SemiSWEET transporter [Candidatus Baltobacteraceae bacterium]